ncbi:MAG TPA: hypothetical protein VH062_32425 [Polyangiaceae bacterium]|nr:hypothetical protein [Polyangiaceae bacterium]
MTINTLGATESLFVLGETLRPLLTNKMGSAIEVFDTKGPAKATKGNASEFFRDVASNVEMNPPDVSGVVRVASTHDIEFVM